MSDILIRGMEMPEGDWEYVSLWLYGDGRVYVSNKASAAYSRRLQDLAVPLPEGHGRLIDADVLLNESCDVVEDHSGLDYIDSCPIWGYSADMINRAPTIIPAEGGENND